MADLALVVDSSGSIRDSNVDGRADNYDFVLEVREILHFPAGVNHDLLSDSQTDVSSFFRLI